MKKEKLNYLFHRQLKYSAPLTKKTLPLFECGTGVYRKHKVGDTLIIFMEEVFDPYEGKVILETRSLAYDDLNKLSDDYRFVKFNNETFNSLPILKRK